MKNFIHNIFKVLLVLLPQEIGIIFGIIAGFIWNAEVGVFVGIGVVLVYIFFICIRQLYWKITRSGDYKNDYKNI